MELILKISRIIVLIGMISIAIVSYEKNIYLSTITLFCIYLVCRIYCAEKEIKELKNDMAVLLEELFKFIQKQ